MNKSYKLSISEKTRHKLYDSYERSPRSLQYYPNRTSTPRVPLAHYFHGRYLDKRPDWLRAANQWSIAERLYRTDVHLTDAQVAAVLKLALAHEIMPRASAKNPSSTYGLVNHLLGTFLDAIANEHLVEII